MFSIYTGHTVDDDRLMSPSYIECNNLSFGNFVASFQLKQRGSFRPHEKRHASIVTSSCFSDLLAPYLRLLLISLLLIRFLSFSINHVILLLHFEFAGLGWPSEEGALFLVRLVKL